VAYRSICGSQFTYGSWKNAADHQDCRALFKLIRAWEHFDDGSHRTV
jgi:hypothetical protein